MSNIEEVTLGEYEGSHGYELGDVNGDSVVDVADVNAAINLILYYDTYKDAYPGNADLDGNSVIDIGDVNAIITIILNS